MDKSYKYVRIQGRELAEFTNYANGVFGIFRDFEKKHVMTEEDFSLYKELESFFCEELPWPPACNTRQRVICFFKTENADEMMRYMKPLLWLLERYNHPYDLIYTNFPGNIIYEDDFQIVVTIDDLVYADADIMKEDMFEKYRASSGNAGDQK